jgi:hypothetical protein
MTAKEALRERIDDLSEEEAAELLAQIEWDATEEEELTPEEIALLDEVKTQFERGEVFDGEKLLRELGV